MNLFWKIFMCIILLIVGVVVTRLWIFKPWNTVVIKCPYNRRDWVKLIILAAGAVLILFLFENILHDLTVSKWYADPSIVKRILALLVSNGAMVTISIFLLWKSFLYIANKEKMGVITPAVSVVCRACISIIIFGLCYILCFFVRSDYYLEPRDGLLTDLLNRLIVWMMGAVVLFCGAIGDYLKISPKGKIQKTKMLFPLVVSLFMVVLLAGSAYYSINNAMEGVTDVFLAILCFPLGMITTLFIILRMYFPSKKRSNRILKKAIKENNKTKKYRYRNLTYRIKHKSGLLIVEKRKVDDKTPQQEIKDENETEIERLFGEEKEIEYKKTDTEKEKKLLDKLEEIYQERQEFIYRARQRCAEIEAKKNSLL